MEFGIYAVITLTLLYISLAFIKHVDDENGLPDKPSIKFLIIATTMGGLSMYFENAYLMVVFCAFIFIEAYTDYYTMQLYLIFSLIVSLGYGYMILAGKISLDIFIEICIFLFLIVISRIVKVINTGDVWMMITLIPYILNIFNFCDGLIVLLSFYLFSLVLGIVINAKDILCNKKSIFPLQFQSA